MDKHDPAATDRLEDRLTGMLRLISDQPANAAHAIQTTLRNASLSIADLRIVVAAEDRESALLRMYKEIAELREDVYRLRGTKGLKWDDFVEACGRKVDITKRDWIKVLAGALAIGTGELRAFQKNDRVPIVLLRKLDQLPDYVPPPAAPGKSRRTNFHDLVGELVVRARLGGMTPGAIRESLDNFLRFFEEKTVTQGMVDGVRVKGSSEILSPDDPSPLTRSEVVAMQTRLWGSEGNVRPMERFFITHIQRDVRGFMRDDTKLASLKRQDCLRLRQRFHAEMELRAKNRNYEKLSKALGLLSKREHRRGERGPELRYHERKVGLTPQQIKTLFARWLNPVDDVIPYIAQLCGYDIRTTGQAFYESDKFPEQMALTLAVIHKVVDCIDIDDPGFEAKVSDNVKRFQQAAVKDGRQPSLLDD